MADASLPLGSDSVKVRKLVSDAIIPTRATPGSAGFDLYAVEDATIERGTRRWVSTGVALELPTGMYARFVQRSGVSTAGIDLGAGLIDSDYQGQIKVLLINNNKVSPSEKDNEPFEVKKGARIAQMVIAEYWMGALKETTEVPEPTERGDKGFGSTGV